VTDLERLARIVCEADGCDPDALVYSLPLATDRRGRILAPPTPPEPTWQHYMLQVRTTLETVMIEVESTDVKAMLADVLEGKDVPTDDAIIEPEPAPSKPHWRDSYGLRHTP
jgi:hypothetical protein